MSKIKYYKTDKKVHFDKSFKGDDMRACNLAINKLAKKYGALSEPMILARSIFNIFTNTNFERQRGIEIIGRILRDEKFIKDVEKNIFREIEDFEVIKWFRS